MKFLPLAAVLTFAGLTVAPSPLLAQPAPTQTVPAPSVEPLGPRLTFITNEYNFGKVSVGTQVNHTFIVSNSGDQTLVISSVAPGCHCTTARDWTHKVEPGKTGEIPLKFDSTGVNGDVTRTITVTSNGKLTPTQILYLRGTVWREIEVNPQTAYMMVMSDATSPSSAVVHIINRGEKPITLSDPTSANAIFKATLKTNVPGKEFELTVIAQSPLPTGNNVGNISIKTSSTNVPILNVTALAMVQPTISVAPIQFVLPPDITGWTTNMVTITANGKKPLVLSDPQVCCDKQIKLDLKEVSPGRLFQLFVVFPPGYKVDPSQRSQVSVKSNNAERPEIVVPITQYQRPPMMPPALARPKVMTQTVPSLQAVGHP